MPGLYIIFFVLLLWGIIITIYLMPRGIKQEAKKKTK